VIVEDSIFIFNQSKIDTFERAATSTAKCIYLSSHFRCLVCIVDVVKYVCRGVISVVVVSVSLDAYSIRAYICSLVHFIRSPYLSDITKVTVIPSNDVRIKIL
jgi:hypothetical protein